MNKLIAVALAALGLWGCASQSRVVPQLYDFGVSAAPADPASSVLVQEIRAPEWLDSTDMLYRLAYRDPRALAPYAASRWAGTPGAMLTVRLRQHLGSAPGAKCTLSASLVEFSQVFDAATASRSVLHLHAAIAANAPPGARAQREFRLEKATPSADAAGGAAAFSTLASDLARELDTWITGTGLCQSQ